MPDNWTLDRLVSFALGLGTLESLDPATIQELGQGLAFLASVHAGTVERQAEVIAYQAETIATQDATIRLQRDALQCLRAGVLLLGEEEAP